MNILSKSTKCLSRSILPVICSKVVLDKVIFTHRLSAGQIAAIWLLLENICRRWERRCRSGWRSPAYSIAFCAGCSLWMLWSSSRRSGHLWSWCTPSGWRRHTAWSLGKFARGKSEDLLERTWPDGLWDLLIVFSRGLCWGLSGRYVRSSRQLIWRSYSERVFQAVFRRLCVYVTIRGCCDSAGSCPREHASKCPVL